MKSRVKHQLEKCSLTCSQSRGAIYSWRAMSSLPLILRIGSENSLSYSALQLSIRSSFSSCDTGTP